jgi:hypothetical protein
LPKVLLPLFAVIINQAAALRNSGARSFLKMKKGTVFLTVPFRILEIKAGTRRPPPAGARKIDRL